MILHVQFKANDKLLKDIQGFLRIQNEHRTAGTYSLHGCSAAVINEFRSAFERGGLDEVDRLIAAINEEIESRGGTEGLGEGAALENSPSGNHLHIFFKNFNTDKVLARETINLRTWTSCSSPD